MTDHTELLEDLDERSGDTFTGPVITAAAEAIRELEELVVEKQGSYDAMFRTMVEAGKKMIKLEEKITELEADRLKLDKRLHNQRENLHRLEDVFAKHYGAAMSTGIRKVYAKISAHRRELQAQVKETDGN